MAEAEAGLGQDPLKTIADAMESAVQAARDGAASAGQAVNQALPEAGNVASKLVYNVCYGLSYGLVFPTLLVARSIPRDNALMNGFADGAKAARDMVDEMKAKPS